MPRSRFGLYFGALGLSSIVTMYLVRFARDDPAFLALVAGPALVCVALIAGWIVMLRRGRRSTA